MNTRLTLGSAPNHNYSDYCKVSSIKESTHISDGIKAVGEVLESFRMIGTLQRDLISLCAEAGDEGANVLMSDYIRAQERLVWMYSAF